MSDCSALPDAKGVRPAGVAALRHLQQLLHRLRHRRKSTAQPSFPLAAYWILALSQMPQGVKQAGIALISKVKPELRRQQEREQHVKQKSRPQCRDLKAPSPHTHGVVHTGALGSW